MIRNSGPWIRIEPLNKSPMCFKPDEISLFTVSVVEPSHASPESGYIIEVIENVLVGDLMKEVKKRKKKKARTEKTVFI